MDVKIILSVLAASGLVLASCASGPESRPREEHMQSNDDAPLRSAELCGFIVTRDGARCREFYEGKLGFRVMGEDPMALVLDAHGRMIRVQKGSAHEPRPYTVLGWNVADIEVAVARLAAAGVGCERFGLPGQDERGIMSFPDGTRVAWFKDPDGNVLSVAQMGARAPR